MTAPAASRDRTVPVVTVDRRRLLLTPGQYATLLYVRHRVAGAGPVTIASMAEVMQVRPGRIVERLDRLTQLGLIGRSSAVGRGHRTLLWVPRRGRLLHGPDRWQIVRTATPFGGFLSREALERRGWRLAGSSGTPPGPVRADPSLADPPNETPARPGTPPVGGPAPTSRPRRYPYPPAHLAATCPRGHRMRLERTSWAPRPRRLEATWRGRCRVCAIGSPQELRLELDVGPPARPSSPTVGSPAWLELMIERHGAGRVTAFLSLVDGPRHSSDTPPGARPPNGSSH